MQRILFTADGFKYLKHGSHGLRSERGIVLEGNFAVIIFFYSFGYHFVTLLASKVLRCNYYQ